MTRDYGSPKFPSKAVVASLYTNLMGTNDGGSGIYVSLNTKKHIIPVILGRSIYVNPSSPYMNDVARYRILGGGYGMRYQFRKLYYSGQILPKIWLGELPASSVEFDLGVSREFNNNLVLRVDIGSGLWYGDRVDYNGAMNPISYQYPVVKKLEYFTNTRMSIGYRF